MGKIVWRKAAAARDRADKRYVAGIGMTNPFFPRARRGPVPGFIPAIAVVRHSLKNERGGD